MKAIFFFGVVCCTCFNCTLVAAQETTTGIPQIIRKTLANKLRNADFAKTGDYWFNLDPTIEDIDDIERNQFKKRRQLRKKIHEVVQGYKDYAVVSVNTFLPGESELYGNRLHYSATLRKGDKEYVFEWWYTDSNQLESFTIALIKE